MEDRRAGRGVQATTGAGWESASHKPRTAKDGRPAPEAGEARRVFPVGCRGSTILPTTLALDFQPPGLRRNTAL